MRSIIFRTPGLASIEALTTLGVSVKESENPIGFFGTGFKFALAWCLRNNHTVSIHWSTKHFAHFGAVYKKIRDREVSIIHFSLDGGEPQALGFTTALGPTWEAWQAYREIHSNTLDEGGEILEHRDAALPWTGRAQETIIRVSGDAFAAAYDKREKYFLQKATLLEQAGTNVEIHRGSTDAMFFRGVRVGSLPGPLATSELTWNVVSSLALTEDRTLKEAYYWGYYVRSSFQYIKDPQIIRKVCCASPGTFEYGCSFEHVTNIESPMAKFLLANVGSTALSPKAAVRALELQEQHYTENPRPFVLPARQKIMLERAVAFLKKARYPVDRYPIVCVESLGKGVSGLARDGQIMITQLAFASSMKELVSTVLEEFLHLEYKVDDESREMQNLLFRELITALADLHGEIL